MSWWAWLTLFVAAGSLMPVFESSGYVRLVGFNTVIYMVLALGLNLVVGWGGLLDLGYIAFFGVGSYAYAIFDSAKFGYHVPSIVIIPAATLIGALVGLLVGLPSRRLSGDYLAIVTLFFLELFETVATNGNQIFGHNVTGGALGIPNVYPLSFFGHTLAVQHQGIFAVTYYYIAIVIFVIVFVALRFVNNSRTGRAWRSLREDPLAAEVMGMPVNWLKLMSFATGAGVAALAGTVSTALNASVYPLNFSPVVLITIYAMVILGGSGSQSGAVLGAILVSVLLQVLQNPGQARVLFYLVIMLGVVAIFRFSIRLAIVAGSTAVFGIVVHAVAGSIHHAWVNGVHGGLAGVIADWVVVPVQLAPWVGQVGVRAAAGRLAGLEPAARLAAPRGAAADPLPRGVRLGEPDDPEPRPGAVHRPRAAADRPDDRAPERPARRDAAWRSSDGRAAPRARRASRWRSAGSSASPGSTCTSTRARSSA